MASAIVLQTLQESIDQTVANVVEFLPRLAAALFVLFVGWVIGRIVYRIVVRAADAVELDRYVVTTPIGRMLGGTEGAVARAFGRMGAWFVYALALLAAADVLAVELLSEWIAQAVSYLPSFVAGALIIVVGFVLADFLGDAIGRTETVTDAGYTAWFADGVRMFLYFVAIVIGLDTMGVDVTILNQFVQAVAIGLAVGLALAIGIGFGWGGKDYVAENIGDWMATGSESIDTGEPATAEDDD